MISKKMNTEEAADFLGIKANTLEVWRSKKEMRPKFKNRHCPLQEC